jgi:hypothetical protein
LNFDSAKVSFDSITAMIKGLFFNNLLLICHKKLIFNHLRVRIVKLSARRRKNSLPIFRKKREISPFKSAIDG